MLAVAATVADFRAQFPDPPFETVDDARISAVLTEALDIHDVNEMATLYCAAHLLALEAEQKDAQGNPRLEPDGGAGVIEKEKVGPTDISYITQAGDEVWRAFFATSAWGRRFLTLEDRTPRVGLGFIVA